MEQLNLRLRYAAQSRPSVARRLFEQWQAESKAAGYDKLSEPCPQCVWNEKRKKAQPCTSRICPWS